MAYAEICACIRTLQEAAFHQESEIFRLREREAHLKQLVKDLAEKLNSATIALRGNESGALSGWELSRDSDSPSSSNSM